MTTAADEKQEMKPEEKATEKPKTGPTVAPAVIAKAIEPQSVALVPRMDSEAFAMGLEPSNIDSAYRLAGVLAKARIGGVTSPDDALARLLAGRELGIPAMTSIRQLFVIDGKIGMEASLAHALCLRSPLCEFFEHVETTDDHATFVTKRRGRPEKRHSFTAQQAKDAGLFDRGEKKDQSNWNRWTRQMLEARAKMQLARLVFPDILGGIYSRDELTSGVYDEPVEVVVDSKVVADAGQVALAAESMRNYDTELEAFKTKAEASKTKAEFAELRKVIEASDWPAGHRQQAADLYTATLRRAKEAAAAKPAAPAADAGRQPGDD